MAPTPNNKNGLSRDESENYGIKVDRKTRKPLVEKKRRARINESLQDLRVLLADTDMENAEVLEMTVKRVESIIQSRAQEVDTVNREASERFAAGYIQCMHEVHTFVSNCPGIDATIAAELLNHLLECMPLNDEDKFQVMIQDIMTDCSTNSNSTWPSSEGIYAALVSPGGKSISSGSSSALSPAHSTTSSDDLCSDLEETDSEQNHISVDAENQDVLNMPTAAYSESMWRPW
ncbi:transcription cofactor HES-6-like isoform 2-T2 [Salvelinus alpinus]|uniref:transcription cofactor HES-6-like isoform X2 n=1 Tax=Salvelinus sp. IW2-2015 TaxID=2691554 RepID=UPI000CDFCC84|nr:transcription cofactor HES-6-like isoform X2 [Salvelinus alpinus]XP_055739113.1 transcription cofactor HES-6-like isoform X2 [Salvelinus fontinalis]